MESISRSRGQSHTLGLVLVEGQAGRLLIGHAGNWVELTRVQPQHTIPLQPRGQLPEGEVLLARLPVAPGGLIQLEGLPGGQTLRSEFRKLLRIASRFKGL